MWNPSHPKQRLQIIGVYEMTAKLGIVSLILLLLPLTSQAQTKTVVPLSSTEGLLIVSTGSISVERVTLQSIGVVVNPGPITPTPDGSLLSVVQQATASVANYPDKDNHAKAMAFGISFLSQGTAQAKSTSEARAIVKQFCDSVVGNQAPLWQNWWSAVNAKLDSMNLTPAQYTSELKVITEGLTGGIASGEESFGVDSYGLDPEFLKFLMTVLLPLLLKLLGVG